MDRAREFLEKIAGGEEADRLRFPPHQPHAEHSFYEYSILRGVRVDSVRLGSTLSCSFTVPPRLTDRNGKLSAGAIASLVDELGAAVIHRDGKPMDVSVDMSIAYISDAKINDELEITSRCLGQRGNYHGTDVLIRNKTTGEAVAQGRHSLFSIPATYPVEVEYAHGLEFDHARPRTSFAGTGLREGHVYKPALEELPIHLFNGRLCMLFSHKPDISMSQRLLSFFVEYEFHSTDFSKLRECCLQPSLPR